MSGIEIGAVVGGIKRLMTTVKNVKEAEVKAELLTQLIELQGTLLEQQEEISVLRERNRRLSAQLDDRDAYSLKNNVYWKGSEEEGPFCPTCGPQANWVRLSTLDGGAWFCAVCRRSPPEIGGGYGSCLGSVVNVRA